MPYPKLQKLIVKKQKLIYFIIERYQSIKMLQNLSYHVYFCVKSYVIPSLFFVLFLSPYICREHPKLHATVKFQGATI